MPLSRDVERLEAELDSRPADNRFEGNRTTRTYNLLAYGEIWQKVPPHPVVLELIEGVLGPECLVSSLASISLGPGETAQVIHADDQVQPLVKPHVATVCNSMWALTDFTEANGATRLVPGSHLWDNPDYFAGDANVDTIPAEMAKGSVLVWHWQHVAWRRRQRDCRRGSNRYRHELLRGLHPPARESATRNPDRGHGYVQS